MYLTSLFYFFTIVSLFYFPSLGGIFDRCKQNRKQVRQKHNAFFAP